MIPCGGHRQSQQRVFCSMKRLGVFLLPLVWMLVHRRVAPSIKFANYPFIHLGGERHCDSYSLAQFKNTTQCSQPEVKPRLLALESSALTMRPPRLSQLWCPVNLFSPFSQFRDSGISREETEISCFGKFVPWSQWTYRPVYICKPGRA